MRPTRLAAATTAVLALVLAGCSGADDGGDRWDQALAEFAYSPVAMRAFAPESLTEALPNTTYETAALGGEAMAFSELVVAGEFVGSARGTARDWGRGGAAVGWRSHRADTRDVRMTFRVDEVVARDDSRRTRGIAQGSLVDVWVVVDGAADADGVRKGMEQMGPALVYLVTHPDRAYASGWTIGMDGALLMAVDPQGGIDPVVHAAAEELSGGAADEPHDDHGHGHDHGHGPAHDHDGDPGHGAGPDLHVTPLDLDAETVRDLARAAEEPGAVIEVDQP